jgi:SNF2 family DNA or RNA helicase
VRTRGVAEPYTDGGVELATAASAPTAGPGSSTTPSDSSSVTRMTWRAENHQAKTYRCDGEQLARLRRRIKPLVKRRTKELVAADLPAKQEQTLEVDLHPRHRKLCDTYLQRERQKILGLIDDFNRNRFTILRSITLLRQLSLHRDLVDDGHDAVPCAKLGATR